MASLLFAVLFVVASAQSFTEVVRGGYSLHNTRDFPSLITTFNVESLTLKFNVSLCGDATSTPLVRAGRVCVSDFGGCYSCFDHNTGALIFRKTMSHTYGFSNTTIARGMPTYDAVTDLVLMGTTGDGNFLDPSGGCWIFAVRFSDGALVWKSLVTSQNWALITDSPIIYNGKIFFGISSSEPAKPYTDPTDTTYTFVGHFYAYVVATGTQLWATPMIPPKYAALNYTGCGIWSSTPALGGNNDIYFGTGEFYTTPKNVSDCLTANPTNQSCVPTDIHVDSIVRVDVRTGVVLSSYRTNAADTWNIACYFNALGVPLPGCVSVSIAYDFDVTSVQYSALHNVVFASSKSGYQWGLTYDLKYRWTKSFVAGSETGGYEWQAALRDSLFPQNMYYVGANTNGNGYNFTLPNGKNASCGVWTAYDGNGNLKWATIPPNNDQVYGTVSLTNGVVLGQTKTKGLLVAMELATGKILWTFQTAGAMNGAPAIVLDRIYWTTGPGNNPSNAEVDQHTLLAFELKRLL